MDAEEAEVEAGADAWNEYFQFGFGWRGLFEDGVYFVESVDASCEASPDSAEGCDEFFASGLYGGYGSVVFLSDCDQLLGAPNGTFGDA